MAPMLFALLGLACNGATTTDTTDTTDTTPPLDEDCALGVSAFCFCLEVYGEPPCSDDESYDFYALCVDGGDSGYFECFGSYVEDDYDIDCGAAVSGCG